MMNYVSLQFTCLVAAAAAAALFTPQPAWGFAPSLSATNHYKDLFGSASSTAADESAAAKTTTGDWVAQDFNEQSHTDIETWLAAEFENQEPPPVVHPAIIAREHDWFGAVSAPNNLKHVQVSSPTLEPTLLGGSEWFASARASAPPPGVARRPGNWFSHTAEAVAPSQSQSVGNLPVSLVGTSDWFTNAIQSASPVQPQESTVSDVTKGPNEWFSQSLFPRGTRAPSHTVASGGEWFTQAIQAGTTPAPSSRATTTTTGVLSRGSSEWFSDATASPAAAVNANPAPGPNEWFSASQPDAASGAAVPKATTMGDSTNKNHDWFAGAVPATTTATTTVAPVRLLEDTRPREWFMTALFN